MQHAEDGHADARDQLYRIDFDMMLKGNVCKRRKEVVRQFVVTVKGSTRLVTSGDVVDRDIYEALLAARAIMPPSKAGPMEPPATDPEDDSLAQDATE